MPEGDTLHRIAGHLGRVLVNATLDDLVLPRLAGPVEELSQQLRGGTVSAVRAYGKYLVMEFRAASNASEVALVTHLKMTGSWHLYRRGEAWRRPWREMRAQVVVRREGERYDAVCYLAPIVRLVPSVALRRMFAGEHIGPDILGPTFDAASTAARLQLSPAEELGVALLDPWCVAGIGNVFKSEMCFRLRQNPFTPVGTLDPLDLARLLSETRQVMQHNVAQQPRLGSGEEQRPVAHYTYQRTSDRSARLARLVVYGRAGQPCVECGEPIQMARQGPMRRSTYFCARCQGVTP
jgi:endonuclease-8